MKSCLLIPVYADDGSGEETQQALARLVRFEQVLLEAARQTC